jgi:parallel beta-helix repeat protein
MRRASLIVISILVMSSFYIAVTVLPGRVKATTRFVGGINPGNYSTIQDAVNNSFPGDTIYVFSGTYYENVVVNKTLSLIGEDRKTTIVNGSADNAFYVNSDWVNITGLTISSGGTGWNDAGIHLFEAHNCSITENIFSFNNYSGINLIYSDDTDIRGNNFSSNKNGIHLHHSEGNIVADNTFFSNSAQVVSLDVSDDNHIVNNTVSGGDWGVYLHNSRGNVVMGNNVSNTNRGIFFEKSDGNTVTGNDLSSNNYASVQLRLSDGNTVVNNQIWYGDYGIHLSESNINHVQNNTGSYNEDGIRIGASSGNTVANNSFSFAELHGILLSSSFNSTITNNALVKDGIYIEGSLLNHWNSHEIDDANTVNGKPVYYWKNLTGGAIPSGAGQIILANCTQVTVEGQDVSNGTVGIEMGFSHLNMLADNTASFNLRRGIDLYTSHNNTIDGSRVSSNGEEGIKLVSSHGTTVSNSIISDNTYAIHMAHSDYTMVINNTISSMLSKLAIFSLISNNNTMLENQLTHGGIILSGDSIENWNSHRIETTNTVNGRPVYYRKNVLGGKIPYGAGQVILANCTGMVVDNQTIGNGSVGIELGFSQDSTIVNNTLSDHLIGIYIEFSNDNKIYHNNFIDNEMQAIEYGTNVWDDGYPSGGNYWSDYAGVDEKSGPNQDLSGSDGIGDTSRRIPEITGEDRYPLMNPYEIDFPPPENQPPVCQILDPEEGAVVVGTLTIEGTASDPDGIVQDVEVRVDDGPWVRAMGTTLWDFEWNTTTVTNGQHTVYARSYDGSSYSTEVSVTVIVNNTISTPYEPEFDWIWILIAVIVSAAVLVLIVILILVRRRKKPEEEEPPT